MRITFLLSSLKMSGGVRAIVEFANRLAIRGHQIGLVIPGDASDADMEKELYASVQLIESRKPRIENANAAYQFLLSWSMAQAVPLSDIVISTHTPTTASGFMSTRILSRGIPVWFYQDYLNMFGGRRVEQLLLKNASRWHRITLTNSIYAAEELRSYAPGRIEVVRIGLSHADHFHPVPIEQRHIDKIYRILTLTDMRPRKGMADFLDAAAIVQRELPNIRLWIVSKEECNVQSELPFEYIHRPSRERLAELYGMCDVFVSTSWWESLGLPALEAMACATPVVMTDSGGVSDYARPGENCLM
ncbi:MAG: glycosyltransferase family 4 protein, partial [Caldilinea sp.]